MKKLIKETHHVALKCLNFEQLEEVKKFYTEILGLPVLRIWGEGSEAGMMIDTGNSIVEVFASGGTGRGNAGIHHFAFLTENVDACIQTVKDAGYEITKEPTDIIIPSNPAYPVRVGFCIGPVGEEIEFFEER